MDRAKQRGRQLARVERNRAEHSAVFVGAEVLAGIVRCYIRSKISTISKVPFQNRMPQTCFQITIYLDIFFIGFGRRRI